MYFINLLFRSWCVFTANILYSPGPDTRRDWLSWVKLLLLAPVQLRSHHRRKTRSASAHWPQDNLIYY